MSARIVSVCSSSPGSRKPRAPSGRFVAGVGYNGRVRSWCALVCGLSLLGAGCEAHRPNTWEHAAPTIGATPRLAPPAPTTVARRHTGSGDDVVSAGVRIDRALVEFSDVRARARRQGHGSGLWHRAWIDVLAAIDEAVTQPPVAGDLGAFVRARATLDVELVNDRRRQALLPEDLERRVQRTLFGVDESVQELRAANAPGTTLNSLPRLADGDLTLRAPLSVMVVSSPFGRRPDPFTGASRYHAGVDLDGEEGTAIFAAATGVVVYAGPQGGYGRYIVVDHGGGVRTHYAHCSTITTSLGAVVEEGDVIGQVGSSGRSTGPHLHFAVTDDLGRFLDPMALLDVPFDSLENQVATSPGPSVADRR
jgi:murein DD-endopeptidase MepM/ murein hydrolase activator NlpD